MTGLLLQLPNTLLLSALPSYHSLIESQDIHQIMLLLPSRLPQCILGPSEQKPASSSPITTSLGWLAPGREGYGHHDGQQGSRPLGTDRGLGLPGSETDRKPVGFLLHLCKQRSSRSSKQKSNPIHKSRLMAFHHFPDKSQFTDFRSPQMKGRPGPLKEEAQ